MRLMITTAVAALLLATPMAVSAQQASPLGADVAALQRQRIPSRFVRIPDEKHWVLKPRNYVDWQREILDWTARWTAPE